LGHSKNYLESETMPSGITNPSQELRATAGSQPWIGILTAWVLVMGLTFTLVKVVEAFGPALLWRDQTKTAWHLQTEAWRILGKAPFGTPERIQALLEAEPLFREAAGKAPGVGRYRINLARLLHEQKRFPEAYQEALAALPVCAASDAESLAYAGELAFLLGKWEEAVNHCSRALVIAPQDAGTRERKALALLKLGRTEEGIETWRKRLEELPATPEDRTRAGAEAAKAGQFRDSAEWLSSPAELGLLAGESWQVLAIARAAEGDIDGAAIALAHFNQERAGMTPQMPDPAALGLPPLDPKAQGNLAAAYRRCFAARWK
jgi:tetratricopeptide (TPR) repeat protein